MSTVITDNEARTYLSSNLVRLLSSRGWSQVDLADRSGISKMQISRIVRGQITPSVSCVHRIAEALDVTIDALLRCPENFSAAV